MARRATNNDGRRRGDLLAAALAAGKDQRDLSYQELSDLARIRYETVKALLGGKSAGPSFFLVADLARALRLNLDTLSEETR